jgi:hypothetical protein
MTRQNRTKSAAPESTENTNTPEENTVDETSTPETPVEGTETPTPEAPVEQPVDLTAFKESVTEALSEGDTATGELPEAAVAKVNEQYRAVEGNKGKGEARKFLEEAMLEAVGKLDAVAARGYSDLRAKLSAAGGAKADKAPSDPTAAFVQRLASLRLAQQIVESERPEGEGIDEKVEALVNENTELITKQREYLANEAEDKGDGPELNPVVRAAFKAASGKATGGTSRSGGSSGGVRHDTGKHIASAFADVEVGTFLTIAEIANHKSAEYGDDTPSQGAISARLFPTTTVAGVEPVEKHAIDGKNPKGARKIAVA